MKIQTLLELIDTKISSVKYRGNLKDGTINHIKNSRSGAYAAVQDDRHDPHMVRKHHYYPLNDTPKDATDNYPQEYLVQDNYTRFAIWLAANKIDNICLPRIYNIKRIEDSSGKYIYKYQIEKLIEGTSLSPKQLLHAFSHYFDLDALRDYKHFDWNDNRSIIRLMGEYCAKYIYSGTDKMIINDELIEALNLIKTFVKDELVANDIGFTMDIANSGNIMFRRTGLGLQMVITDPVA